MTSEFMDTFDGLPADPKKRDLIKGYVLEALEHKQAQDLAKKKEAEVYDSVKESEEFLQIDPAYFKALVAFKFAEDKKEKELNKLSAAKEGLELLGLDGE